MMLNPHAHVYFVGDVGHDHEFDVVSSPIEVLGLLQHFNHLNYQTFAKSVLVRTEDGELTGAYACESREPQGHHRVVDLMLFEGKGMVS